MLEYSFDLAAYPLASRIDEATEYAQYHGTPLLLLDTDIIQKKYIEMRDNLPYAQIYYAVKANPKREVLQCLANLGSSFDIASRYEFDMLESMGIAAERMSFGNTIKKASDIAYCYQKGVRYFATDSYADLAMLARHAPHASIFFRLSVDGEGADWPLSRKFGASIDMILHLIEKAVQFSLNPYGISFHVGSQQRNIGQWAHAIGLCRHIFDQTYAHYGVRLAMINVGGGFPARYYEETATQQLYLQEINRFLHDEFTHDMPEIWIEPGRSLVGDSGMLCSEIVLISQKNEYNKQQWVYLDVGLFGGLIETLGEAIRYPIYFKGSGVAQRIILAGPTCDSMDILYEHTPYYMPETCQIGDLAYIFTTGAYTETYSSYYFNGFSPLKSIVM